MHIRHAGSLAAPWARANVALHKIEWHDADAFDSLA